MKKDYLRKIVKTTILPRLKKLENERKASSSDLSKFLTWCIIAYLLILTFNEKSGSNDNPYLFSFLAIVGLFISNKLFQKKQLLKSKFKSLIVKEITPLILEGLQYFPDGKISKNIFDSSGLFSKYYTSYASEDHFIGNIHEAPVQFGKICVTLGFGNYKKIIFHGLFISTKHNKKISANTFVFPDLAEKNLGYLGKFFQDNTFNKRAKHLINLENIDFEKEFAVYGDDQIESRYILTPKLMESFLKIKAIFNAPIYASFKKDMFYMGIHNERELFEFDTDKEIMPNMEIQKLVTCFKKIIFILNELEIDKDKIKSKAS